MKTKLIYRCMCVRAAGHKSTYEHVTRMYEYSSYNRQACNDRGSNRVKQYFYTYFSHTHAAFSPWVI